ncbi:MAG: porphobilinogen synthase [Bdellovibrionota bacterium]|jgi:porphobilinogen synthase
MAFPTTRLRRLRRSAELRDLVRETNFDVKDLIAPLFVVCGENKKEEISSLPKQYHFSVDTLLEEVSRLKKLGVTACLLFGVPEYKDETGSAACKDDGVVQCAVRAIKKHLPQMLVITDLCFCEYTSHGHCGILCGTELDNDRTLEIIAAQALSHARAGADIIAPSGMIDGAVQCIRKALDGAGFQSVAIMSYAAKFSSSFYGPFREAAQSAPSFGDRKGYQMDPANVLEALREVELDILEGADIVMVKPALSYLDVLYRVKERFQVPTAAYQVSGEYAMIKAAAARGWIDEMKIVQETLLSIKRAGADMIITYFAGEVAEELAVLS